MPRILLKDPIITIFVGLSLFMVPMIVFLFDQYSPYQERLRQAALPSFVPAPSPEMLLEHIKQAEPSVRGMEMEQVYTPNKEPRSGIIAVYNLVQRTSIFYKLVLFRHDISCSTCKDILATALYDAKNNTLVWILLIESWEVRGEPVNAEPFLSQFIGQKSTAQFQIGKNVDGLTGATYSAVGLVSRLNEVAVWLAAQAPDKDVASSLIPTEERR